jgi:hypothetical protein
MNIRDFADADCRLFRIPPIDFSNVAKIIEDTLLDAWQQSNNASYTFSRLVENKDILDRLSPQLQESLRFQRENELRRIQEEEKRKKEELQTRYKGQINEIKSSYDAKIEVSSQAAKKAEGVMQRISREYSAAQASLEEMRRRIKSQIDDVGGREKLDRLIRINNSLLGEETIPPVINDTTSYSPEVNRQQQEQTPKESRGFWRKVWRVLNYKVW